eukprot:3137984-Amphidinium_carterae.1
MPSACNTRTGRMMQKVRHTATFALLARTEAFWCTLYKSYNSTRNAVERKTITSNFQSFGVN